MTQACKKPVIRVKASEMTEEHLRLLGIPEEEFEFYLALLRGEKVSDVQVIGPDEPVPHGQDETSKADE